MSKVVKGVAVAAAIMGVAILAPMLLPGAAAAFAGSAAVWGVATALATSALINGVVAQLQSGKRPAQPTLNVNYAGTVEPRRIIYGEVRLGGMETIPPVTSGSNNKYLHQVLTLAGHEVYAITGVYFGQDAVGTMTAVTGSSSDGLVTTGTYANKAWVRRYLGTSTQAADFILDSALSIWTSAHQGKGVAYLAIQYEYDESVYKTGKPQVTAQVQGKKVYDPRKDSTNGGSGSHRYATPSTWEYSTNPALCLADYLMDAKLGMAADPTEIDWTMVASAADECDELVAIPTASTQKRYTFNGVLYATDDYDLNRGKLTGAMLGSCIFSGGKWRIRAGAWEAASFAISEANVINAGTMEIQTSIPYRDRYNGIRGTYLDPDNLYQAAEFPPTQDASYVTADGESVFRDVRFEACTNVYEAQRAAIILTRKSRQREAATIPCDMSLFKVRPGDTGIVSISELGWVNKQVRCEGWKFNPQGWVELAVREELSSDWNDPLESDYLTPLAITTPTPVYFTPDAPGSLTIVHSPKGPILSWTKPAVITDGTKFRVYEYTANTPFSSASLVWEGAATSVLIPHDDTVARYYWVQTITANGVTSATPYPNGNGILGYATIHTTLFARGTCVATTTSVRKSGGSSAWDSDVVSLQGFSTCHVQFKANQTNAFVMVGVDRDPLTSQDFAGIDFCWQLRDDGTVQIYSAGVSVGSFGSYTTSTLFDITYDGTDIRFLKDGIEVWSFGWAGYTIYFDSSFYSPGAAINSVRFGPGTQPGLLDTPQLQNEAATQLWQGDTTSGATWVSAAVGTWDFVITGLIIPHSLVPAEDCDVVVTIMVAEASATVPTGNVYLGLGWADNATPGVPIISEYSVAAATATKLGTTAQSLTLQYTFSHSRLNSGATGKQCRLDVFAQQTAAGNSATVQNLVYRVEFIKR